MKQNTFHKSERLCSKKILDALFTKGTSYVSHPIRIIFSEVKLPQAVPVQVAFSVSKKRFNKAVDRNRIKRQLREAWRLNTPIVKKTFNK